ncbi:MAG: AAA domain-containing protein [Bacteroidetes bacterium]|nr:AAA domain-containing protein [Bacteroidota bacterium]
MRFHSGGLFVVPLTDNEAFQLQDNAVRTSTLYAQSLQKFLYNENRLELLLEEQVAGPILEDKIDLEFPASANKISHQAFFIELDVFYNEGPNQYWALIPVLGIESVAKSKEQLFERLRQLAQAHLNRKRQLTVLERVISTLWFDKPELEEQETSLQVPYPWDNPADTGNSRKSWLVRVSSPLLKPTAQVAFGRSDELKKLQRATSNPYNKSTVLIGPSGSGKSALIYEFARNYPGILPVIWETTAAKLIKELTADGGWQDMVSFLVKELSRDNKFLYVRQLKELFEVGKYEGNNISLAEYLIPALQRGEINLLSECTPEDRNWIERKSPGFFNNLQTIGLPKLGKKLPAVIKKKISPLAAEKDLKLLTKGVEETIDLHSRFFPYAGEPGQSIRFLENLIRENGNSIKSINRKAVTAYFSAQSGIPQPIIDPESPFDPKALNDIFGNQVFGQDQAVQGLTDMLGAVKNQLVRSDKPIASFLFIGPTGVGKTELSKVLAEYMFGDRNRMERFDMSEFSSASSVFRLTGPGGGLLTSTIRRNPFCVLLFDELEKAHPNFFDLLLQILGEGRLTDQDGKMVNFCSTIIIMTSNIGAAAAGASAISLQKGRQKIQLREHFLRAVQKHLRPELFNRIDRIIPFDPLSPEVMRKVVDREIALLRLREGINHTRVELNINEAVLQYLAKAGYNEKMGARQLQRCIREELAIPLARQLNAASVDEHMMVEVDLKDNKPDIKLEVDPLNVELWLEEYEKVSLVEHISQLRRELQNSRQSHIYIQFLSELDILNRQNKRNESEFHLNAQKVRNLSSFSDEVTRMDQLQSRIDQLEEEISLAVFGINTYLPEIAERVDEWKKTFAEVRASIYQAMNPGQDICFFSIFGKNPKKAVRFYQRLFDLLELEYDGKALQIVKSDPVHFIPKPESELWEEPDGVESKFYGWTTRINGPGAEIKLRRENGIFEIQEGNEKPQRFLVNSHQHEIGVPNTIHRKETYNLRSPYRVLNDNRMDDVANHINRELAREEPEKLVAEALKEYFNKFMESVWDT